MALAVVQRNALLERVWERLLARDHPGIAELVGDLPLEEHLREPELGVMLCYAWYQLGELERGLFLVGQLTEVCERRGNTWLSRRRLNCEGLLRDARSEPAEAEPLFQEVLSRAEEAGDGQMVAWAHNNLGMVYAARGLWDFALSHFRRSVAAGQRLGEVRHIALCHLNTGSCYLEMRRYDSAREHLDRAAELARNAGSETEIAYIDWTRARVYLAAGDLSLARAMADQARERFAKLKHQFGVAGLHQIYGGILIREGRAADARVHLEEAMAGVQPHGEKMLKALVLESFADLSLLEGSRSAAAEHLERAIAEYSSLGNAFHADRLRSRLESVHGAPPGQAPRPSH